MANSIAFARNYTAVIDEVYQRAAVSGCLNSPRRMARAGRNAKEIMIPKIEVSGLGDYTRNVGYKTGSITYEFETKTFNYDRGIRLLADVMDVEEAGVLDCFVEAGSELQRVQVAPEADAFTFAEIAGHEGVESVETDYADAEAEDVLADLRGATSEMDELQVSASCSSRRRSRACWTTSAKRTPRAPTACSRASHASLRCRRSGSTRRSTCSPAKATSSATSGRPARTWRPRTRAS